MTDADKINARIHAEIEGKCVHKEVYLSECTLKDKFWQCANPKCGAKFTNEEKHEREKQIPKYLEDGAYILGLVFKYKISIIWSYDGKEAYVNGILVRGEEEIHHAIALAALKKGGE